MYQKKSRGNFSTRLRTFVLAEYEGDMIPCHRDDEPGNTRRCALSYRMETKCKVVQNHRLIRVSLRAKAEGFSGEDSDLFKVPCHSKLVVATIEMKGKQNQRDGSLGVAGWAQLQRSSIKVDHLVNISGSFSMFKLGGQKLCP